MNPKQVKGLVPAKNEEQIGLANPDEKKFFVLDNVYLSVWVLCNGERSEDQIAKEFIKVLKENSKGVKAKIDEKLIAKNVKDIIKKLKKFCLIE